MRKLTVERRKAEAEEKGFGHCQGRFGRAGSVRAQSSEGEAGLARAMEKH